MSTYSIFNTTLSSIGRALRYRLNENNYYHPSEMPDAINRIPLKQQDPYPPNQNIAFVNFSSFNIYWNYYIVDNADVPNSYGNITRISAGYGIPIYAKTYHGNCYLFTNEGYTFPEHFYGYGSLGDTDINWVVNHKILTNYVSYFSFRENFTLENILSYNFSNLKYIAGNILGSTNNLFFLNNYNIKYLGRITPSDTCYMEESWIGSQVEALQDTYSSQNFIFNCQRIKCPQSVKYMSGSFASTMGRPTEAEIPEGLIIGYGAFQFSNKIQHYYCNGANSLTNLKYAQYMFARDNGPIDATIENRINFHFNFNTPYIMNYQMIFRNTPYYGPVLKKPITYVLTNEGLRWLYASGLSSISTNILNPQQVILNNIDKDLPKHGYEFPDICFPYTSGTLEYIVSNVDDYGQFNNFYFKFGNITMLNNSGTLNFRDFLYRWSISEYSLSNYPMITQTNVKTIGDFGDIYSAGNIYAYYIDSMSKGRRNVNFFPHLTCGGINVGNIICEKNFEQIIGFQTNLSPTAYAPNMTSIGSYKNIISYNGNINTGDMQGTPFVLSNKEAPPNYRCNYLTIGNIIAYNGNVDLNMMLYKKALGGCTEGFQCHDIIGQNINLSYFCYIQSGADQGYNTINHYLINAPKIHDIIATHNINCAYGLFPTGGNFPYLKNGISINLLKADNIYLSNAFHRSGVIGQNYSVENLKNLCAINLIECNNLYGYGCFGGGSGNPSLQTNIDQFEMNIKCSNNLYWGYFLRYSFYNNAIFRFYYNQNSASINPSIDIRFLDWISISRSYYKMTIYVEKNSPYDLQLYNGGQINNQIINAYWDTNEITGQPELISNYNMIWTVIPNGYCNSKSNIYVYNNL